LIRAGDSWSEPKTLLTVTLVSMNTTSAAVAICNISLSQEPCYKFNTSVNFPPPLTIEPPSFPQPLTPRFPGLAMPDQPSTPSPPVGPLISTVLLPPLKPPTMPPTASLPRLEPRTIPPTAPRPPLEPQAVPPAWKWSSWPSMSPIGNCVCSAPDALQGFKLVPSPFAACGQRFKEMDTNGLNTFIQVLNS